MDEVLSTIYADDVLDKISFFVKRLGSNGKPSIFGGEGSYRVSQLFGKIVRCQTRW